MLATQSLLKIVPRTALALFCTLFVFNCSSPQLTPMPQAPKAETDANLVGDLCKDMQCSCTGDSVGKIPEGKKRFRITLGPTQSEIWATVDGNTLYKGIEGATSCFYLDLAIGEHTVNMHAKGRGGFGARMLISEFGEKGWYKSFEFSCGAPGLCDRASLRNWKERISGVDAGKHAPCGSVRISGIDWIEGKMPDDLHPETFFLQAVMKVYKFTPKHAPGSAECIKH